MGYMIVYVFFNLEVFRPLYSTASYDPIPKEMPSTKRRVRESLQASGLSLGLRDWRLG